MHAELEHYLKTGERTMSQTALAGLWLLPEPGPDLRVEESMLRVANDLSTAVLYIDGIPVAGHRDVVNPRGVYVDPEGNLQADRAGSIEVIDHKSTKSFEWCKTGPKLRETVQMVVYGAHALLEYPDAPGVRLSHIYYRTEGKPEACKTTVWCSREEIARRMESITLVVRSACSSVRVPKDQSNKVEANERACSQFRGCPRSFDGSCSVRREKTLAELLGEGSAMALKNVLIDLPATTPAPVVELSMLEQLELEEKQAIAAAKAKPVEPPPTPPMPQLPPGFADACSAIEKSGLGFPTMSADAGAYRAAMSGHSLSMGASLAGSGRLAKINIRTVAEALQLAQEATAQAAKLAAAAVPAILPPDAPASDPALASKPVEGFSTPTVDPVAAMDVVMVESLAPALAGLPADVPTPAEGAAAAVAATDPPKTKRKPGRPKTAPATTETAVETKTTEDDADGGFDLYINAIPSIPYETLDAYVASLCEALCKRYGAADVRCAPKGSVLEYAQWKGVVAAFAKSSPPKYGTFVIHTISEIHEIVAEALSQKASMYVRGVRS